MDVSEYLTQPEPLPGDPVLRRLIGLVDCGEVRGVEIVLNVAGQMMAGSLISAAAYAAATDDIISRYKMTDESLLLIREMLLMAAPNETDEDPYGFNHANYVHLLRSDIKPASGKRPLLWRGPIESVDAWSLSH